MVALVMAAADRHASEFWDSMPDVRQNYDLLFVGVFGGMFLASVVGVLKRKKWGYEFIVSFNYVLAFLSFIPIIGLAIYCFKSGVPVSEIPLKDVAPNIYNGTVSIVSLAFALLIRRKNVSSVFKNM